MNLLWILTLTLLYFSEDVIDWRALWLQLHGSVQFNFTEQLSSETLDVRDVHKCIQEMTPDTPH